MLIQQLRGGLLDLPLFRKRRALGLLGDEGLILRFACMDAHEHEEQRAGKETSLLREKL